MFVTPIRSSSPSSCSVPFQVLYNKRSYISVLRQSAQKAHPDGCPDSNQIASMCFSWRSVRATFVCHNFLNFASYHSPALQPFSTTLRCSGVTSKSPGCCLGFPTRQTTFSKAQRGVPILIITPAHQSHAVALSAIRPFET